jgi:hypothetical protein
MEDFIVRKFLCARFVSSITGPRDRPLWNPTFAAKGAAKMGHPAICFVETLCRRKGRKEIQIEPLPSSEA